MDIFNTHRNYYKHIYKSSADQVNSEPSDPASFASKSGYLSIFYQYLVP